MFCLFYIMLTKMGTQITCSGLLRFLGSFKWQIKVVPCRCKIFFPEFEEKLHIITDFIAVLDKNRFEASALFPGRHNKEG